MNNLDEITKPIAKPIAVQEPDGASYAFNLINFKGEYYVVNEDKQVVIDGIKEFQEFLSTNPRVTKSIMEQNGIDFLKHMQDVTHVDDFHIMSAPPGEGLRAYGRDEVAPHVVVKSTADEHLVREAMEKIGEGAPVHKVANYILVSIASIIKSIDETPGSSMWSGFLTAVKFFNGDKGIMPQIESVLNQAPQEVFDLFRVWKFLNFQIEFHRESAYICTDVIKYPAELASKLNGESPYLDYTIKVSFGPSTNLKKYTFSDLLDGVVVPGNPGQRDIITFDNEPSSSQVWSAYLSNHPANQDGEPELTESLYKLAHLPMYVDEERQNDIYLGCVIENIELVQEPSFILCHQSLEH